VRRPPRLLRLLAHRHAGDHRCPPGVAGDSRLSLRLASGSSRAAGHMPPGYPVSGARPGEDRSLFTPDQGVEP
jgi:hypothetical protein